MEIFKTPTELLDIFTNSKASLIALERQYENKTKGDVFFKTHNYHVRKLEDARTKLNNYCTHGTTKEVTSWEILIEQFIKKDISKEVYLEIKLDSRLSSQEVCKLIMFNFNCIVLKTTRLSRFPLGKITFL